MARAYTAFLKRNLGRKALNVEFRHPLRNDSNNKPGRKTHRSLGTESEEEALHLVAGLNELLRNESLWSVGARPLAAKLYGEKVAEIFYGEIEPRGNATLMRDKFIRLPLREEGYAQVLLLGVPGAGKTTLVRQFLGTHPKSERFPATSVNRTTTFPTEIILQEGDYEAVVTFMSEHETRFEVEEAVSAALVEAIESNAIETARAFLEKSDMRFRLKYLLGEFSVEETESDPYDDAIEDSSDIDSVDATSQVEQTRNQRLLSDYIERILQIALQAKAEFEKVNGGIAERSGVDRQQAVDQIQENAVDSENYIDLVSDVLVELKTKFDIAKMLGGDFEKTTTGWPKAWYLKSKATDREYFLAAIRTFSDNHFRSWGKLLTPLVSSIRIRGPFSPRWAEKPPRLIFMDTEGLGHKADDTADLPEHVLPLIDAADVVLLVESAKTGMTNLAAGKTLEAVVNTGHTRKMAVVFTGMDLVKGDNLKGRAKVDHVFGGLRNVIDNQLAKNVSADAARSLLEHLKESTFYVGNIDQLDPVAAKPELNKLVHFLSTFQLPIFEPVVFPRYRDDKLGFAIQEAAQEFRQQWKGYLGLSPSVTPKHYNTIKALSRRYAEGWNDEFSLRPASNLVAVLLAGISRYLETPIEWSGDPTTDQKRDTIDRIKTKVTRALGNVVVRRLRQDPRPQWQEAYSFRGTGSTKPRASRIESIFEKHVPVPSAASDDREVWEFLDEVKNVVEKAIVELRSEIVAAQQPTKVAG